jgi:Helix-turn-helix domain
MKKKPTPKKKAAHKGTADTANAPKNRRTDGESQILRFLIASRIAPRTTVELSREFDILHPPARVLQLRKRGYEIDTVWVRVETEPGVFHRVGKYVLRKEPTRRGTA